MTPLTFISHRAFLAEYHSCIVFLFHPIVHAAMLNSQDCQLFLQTSVTTDHKHCIICITDIVAILANNSKPSFFFTFYRAAWNADAV